MMAPISEVRESPIEVEHLRTLGNTCSEAAKQLFAAAEAVMSFDDVYVKNDMQRPMLDNVVSFHIERMNQRIAQALKEIGA
jgi:hypothetical protein